MNAVHNFVNAVHNPAKIVNGSARIFKNNREFEIFFEALFLMIAPCKSERPPSRQQIFDI